jgi:peptide/nickel transport system ATP-binding protein
MQSDKILLDVKNLKVCFATETSDITAVEDVSFQIKKGETVALVGESGCGKSVTSLAVMGLINSPGRIAKGQIFFEGKDLLKLSNNDMRKIRGNKISMIFQEPLTSLNPLFTVGNQISEAIYTHQKISKEEAKKKSINMLEKVGIPRPEYVYECYPHSLSGGMRQRVMIAMALSGNQKLLIADEPTTALDVTIQAQILELMKDLIHDSDTSIILITHDLGVVAEMADKVIIMYAGQIVEQADIYDIFSNPLHPYTKGLLESTIKIENQKDKLQTIEGTVPDPSEMPKGCRFNPRCTAAEEKCHQQLPSLIEVKKGRFVRCWKYETCRGGAINE